jgi:hypothetical protein
LIILMILGEEYKSRNSSYSFHQIPVISSLFGQKNLISTLY